MDENKQERLVRCFERIATALEVFNHEVSRAGNRFWPDPKPQREAVATRVPTEADKIREAQGASDKPVLEWLAEIGTEEEELIGEREREWRRTHAEEAEVKVPDASSEGPIGNEKVGRGPKKAKDKA